MESGTSGIWSRDSNSGRSSILFHFRGFMVKASGEMVRILTTDGLNDFIQLLKKTGSIPLI